MSATNPIFFGLPILEVGVGLASYYLLEDHQINDNLILAGTTITISASWIPTPNVDPLNVNAVNAFYAAGPRDLGLFRQQWVNIPVTKPITYWVPAPPGVGGRQSKLIDFGLPILEVGTKSTPNLWVLTGLGSNHDLYPPKAAFLNHPVQGYPN